MCVASWHHKKCYTKQKYMYVRSLLLLNVKYAYSCINEKQWQ